MNRIDQKTLDELSDLAAEITDQIGEYDAARQIADAEFAKVIEVINDKRQRAYELLEDCHREAEEYFDDRSERWQDGEKGQAYASWRDELDRIKDEVAEQVEAPEIPDLEEPSWLSEIRDPSWAEPDE